MCVCVCTHTHTHTHKFLKVGRTLIVLKMRKTKQKVILGQKKLNSENLQRVPANSL